MRTMDIQRVKPASTVDIAEKGRAADGSVISLDRRLFMQFMALGAPGTGGGQAAVAPTQQFVQALEAAGVCGALYEDVNDPYGLGMLTFSEEPEDFFGRVRPMLRARPFADLQIKPEFTMLGRTYALGYESDLEKTLITRPIERATDPNLPWVVWYPVRRSGAFEQLSADEQRTILMEHGGIGRAYGNADLAYDIRLACFGLNKEDNDFIVGLVGHALYPLSNIVERMRKTKQTSTYLTSLGPFFIGKAVWQSERGV